MRRYLEWTGLGLWILVLTGFPFFVAEGKAWLYPPLALAYIALFVVSVIVPAYLWERSEPWRARRWYKPG